MSRFLCMSYMFVVFVPSISCNRINKPPGQPPGQPPQISVKVIDGRSDGGNKWDPMETVVKVGDTVRWVSKSGFRHGVVFTKWSVAKEVLEVTGGLEIKPQPGFGEDAHGTDGVAPEAILVEARIKEFPEGETEIPFICTFHGTSMNGKLVLNTD